ncbi:MAG TPA: hypothetical protein VGM01_04510, partial [Ktedonobacteraceae bacterium]
MRTTMVLSEQNLSLQKLLLMGIVPEWLINLSFVQIEEWIEALSKRSFTAFSPMTSNPFQELTQSSWHSLQNPYVKREIESVYSGSRNRRNGETNGYKWNGRSILPQWRARQNAEKRAARVRSFSQCSFTASG